MNTFDPVIVGIELKILRERKRLTQDEAAKSQKISKSYLCLIENGKRDIPLKRLMSLLHGYNCSLSRFAKSLEI